MYENEVKEVEANYKKWLCNGNIQIKDLVKYVTGEFQIKLTIVQYYGIIELGYENDSIFKKIGEPIIFDTNNNEVKYDVALLLLYIAERLDNANENAPAFLRREERYFFMKVKTFIKKTPLI